MNFTKRTYRRAWNMYLDEALWYTADNDPEMAEYYTKLVKKIVARGQREKGMWK